MQTMFHSLKQMLKNTDPVRVLIIPRRTIKEETPGKYKYWNY